MVMPRVNISIVVYTSEICFQYFTAHKHYPFNIIVFKRRNSSFIVLLFSLLRTMFYQVFHVSMGFFTFSISLRKVSMSNVVFITILGQLCQTVRYTINGCVHNDTRSVVSNSTIYDKWLYS